jgi:alpha-galactosidase
MPISYHKPAKTFFLHGPASTYALAIGHLGTLLHLHWGAKLREGDFRHVLPTGFRAFSPNPDPARRDFSTDVVPQEFPTYGRSDFRSPALEITFVDGSRVVDLAYNTHRIVAGKPKLPGLPATYVENKNEADTLEIDLVDKKTGLLATLSYTVYRRWNAIARSVSIRNGGGEVVQLRRALSASVDLSGSRRELIQLSGSWARERAIIRSPLRSGVQSIESRRGSSSSMQNPFIALVDEHTDEAQGEARGFSLVYSGNFLAQVEVDPYDMTRVQLGLNPFDFSWRLEPGEVFQSPEAVLVFSKEGLNGLSQTYHELYRTRLARGFWRDRERPILINNWEATYFDFDAEKLLAIAGHAKKAGVELLVLDDGWFGRRNNDHSSLGDWFENKEKLPRGLADLVRRINKLGMKFGLWFEPEMVSPDSDLYRAHPDWCLHVPGRVRSEFRKQLVLDLSRREVCDWIVETLSAVLASTSVTYVKWDMNRNMTEIGSATLPPERQAETAHRYMLGLYSVMERITKTFPQVLFESCSGGGGRFDPGLLYYMPQTWTSDNTDPIARLQIQYGTSLVYPISAMGAHVAAVPNHQVGRVTSIATRGHVAMSGNLGYELDLGSLVEAERKQVAEQIAFYKRKRRLIQFGTFHRLVSHFEENAAAWMIVSPDQTEALVWHTYTLIRPNPPDERLRLQGLDSARDYRSLTTQETFGGDFLHEVGLSIPRPHADFQSVLWELKATASKREKARR